MRISDWSSDVCSSDLICIAAIAAAFAISVGVSAQVTTGAIPGGGTGQIVHLFDWIQIPSADGHRLMFSADFSYFLHQLTIRSEERRVGKELVRKCRSRWSQYH